MSLFFNLEAERSILGSILLDNESLRKCIQEGLNVQDFYDKKHSQTYNACLVLCGQNIPIDILTVSNVLKGKVEPAYLMELFEEVISSANIRRYIKIVKEKHILRECYKIAQELQKEIKAGAEVPGVLDSIIQRFLYIKENVERKEEQSFWETTKEVAKESRDNINASLEYPLPFKSLERDTQGLHRGELTMIGGKQKIGKSCFTNTITLHLLKLGKKGLLISAEMNRRLIAKRFITMITKKNVFYRGVAVEEEEIARIENYKFKVIDKAMTIMDIRTEIELYAPDFVVVDYLQIMNIEYGRENRAKAVGEFGMQLKNLALQYNIPIIALSQLNDKEELRESRELEQHSDNCWLIKRKNEKEVSSNQETLILHNKYNRNGAVGSGNLIFIKKNLTFYEETTGEII